MDVDKVLFLNFHETQLTSHVARFQTSLDKNCLNHLLFLHVMA